MATRLEKRRLSEPADFLKESETLAVVVGENKKQNQTFSYKESVVKAPSYPVEI